MQAFKLIFFVFKFLAHVLPQASRTQAVAQSGFNLDSATTVVTNVVAQITQPWVGVGTLGALMKTAGGMHGSLLDSDNFIRYGFSVLKGSADSISIAWRRALADVSEAPSLVWWLARPTTRRFVRSRDARLVLPLALSVSVPAAGVASLASRCV